MTGRTEMGDTNEILIPDRPVVFEAHWPEAEMIGFEQKLHDVAFANDDADFQEVVIPNFARKNTAKDRKNKMISKAKIDTKTVSEVEIDCLEIPTKPTRDSFTRQVSGLGMEDPVFGLNSNHSMSRKAAHKFPLDSLFEDMCLEDIPADMREDLVSVCSDPTASVVGELEFPNSARREDSQRLRESRLSKSLTASRQARVPSIQQQSSQRKSRRSYLPGRIQPFVPPKPITELASTSPANLHEKVIELDTPLNSMLLKTKPYSRQTRKSMHAKEEAAALQQRYHHSCQDFGCNPLEEPETDPKLSAPQHSQGVIPNDEETELQLEDLVPAGRPKQNPTSSRSPIDRFAQSDSHLLFNNFCEDVAVAADAVARLRGDIFNNHASPEGLELQLPSITNPTTDLVRTMSGLTQDVSVSDMVAKKRKSSKIVKKEAKKDDDKKDVKWERKVTVPSSIQLTIRDGEDSDAHEKLLQSLTIMDLEAVEKDLQKVESVDQTRRVRRASTGAEKDMESPVDMLIDDQNITTSTKKLLQHAKERASRSNYKQQRRPRSHSVEGTVSGTRKHAEAVANVHRRSTRKSTVKSKSHDTAQRMLGIGHASMQAFERANHIRSKFSRYRKFGSSGKKEKPGEATKQDKVGTSKHQLSVSKKPVNFYASISSFNQGSHYGGCQKPAVPRYDDHHQSCGDLDFAILAMERHEEKFLHQNR